MLTKNYIHVLAASFVTGEGTINLSTTNYEGSSCSIYAAGYQGTHMVLTKARLSTYIDIDSIVFGTGTTPPTVNDTTLSGDVITGINITCLTGSKKITANEKGVTVTNVYTIFNNNSNAITVGEIAWFGSAYTTSSGLNDAVMFDRSVLPEPVTIPVGATALIEYTIDFSFPIA